MKGIIGYIYILLNTFLICQYASITNAYKILGVFPTMAKSHFIVGSALMKGLAEHGHEVTVISPFPQKTPIKNWRDIPTVSVLERTKEIMANLLDMRDHGVIESFVHIFNMGVFLTNLTFQDEYVQDFMKNAKNEKFDLVITEIFLNEAMLGFGHLFNAPVIGVSTFGASPWTCELVGSPSPPSYVPSPFLGFTDHMTFLERLGNLAVTIFDKLYSEFRYLPRQVELYNSYFPEPKPLLHDVRRNVSLVLLNNHFSINYPRPYVPNMIEVGGMHVNRKTKPLPTEIQKFIESAKDGVIYFSMGSNLKSKSIPKEKLNIILNTFKGLKQKILWKFEDKILPGKPDNVYISDWFSQDDILAHPNVKLFITHGGLLSTTEAIYHGVPIIGIPMFGDQFLNMARAVKAGFGLTVDYNQLNEAVFKSTILEMINNDKYDKNMKAISQRYRDQPMTPLDTAIYWVEYVARHKGASHLHSAGQDLSFIAYHSIDTYSVLIASVLIILWLFKAMITKLCSCIFSNNKKNQQKSSLSQNKKKQ